MKGMADFNFHRPCKADRATVSDKDRKGHAEAALLHINRRCDLDRTRIIVLLFWISVLNEHIAGRKHHHE